jgi:hypothetical protein
MLEHSEKQRPSARNVEAGSLRRALPKRTWGYYVFRQGLRTLLKPEHCDRIWLDGIREAVVLPTGRQRTA